MTFLRPTPYLPAHYLKRFHPDYTDMSEIEKEISSRGVETWTDVMNQEWKQEGLSPNRPFLSAWVPVNSYKDPIFTIKRNPYYFKVDSAGNQLPYIDQIDMERIQGGGEAFFLKSISGDVDWFIAGAFGGLDSLPLAVQKGIENDFRIIDPIPNCANSVGTTWFNLFHPDPVMREVLGNKDFRLALSHAVDRDEVNQLLFKGAGRIGNPSLASGPPYYGERFAQVGLEYDVDLANRMLDQVGLNQRDSDGFRLRSDGERMRILLSVPNKWSLLATEAASCTKATGRRWASRCSPPWWSGRPSGRSSTTAITTWRCTPTAWAAASSIRCSGPTSGRCSGGASRPSGTNGSRAAEPRVRNRRRHSSATGRSATRRSRSRTSRRASRPCTRCWRSSTTSCS